MAEIIAAFTASNLPLVSPGTAPTVRVRRIDTQALVVTDSAMTEIGDGLYGFTFAPSSTLEYSWRADGDPAAAAQVTASERYVFGAISGITDARIEADVPAILIDTAAIPTAAVVSDAVWDEARSGHVVGGSFGEGVASVAAGGITAASFAAAALHAISDGVLTRVVSNVESLGASPAYRCLAGAIQKIVNRTRVNGSTLEVYEIDDSTVSYSSALTTSASADAIVEVDPA